MAVFLRLTCEMNRRIPVFMGDLGLKNGREIGYMFNVNNLFAMFADLGLTLNDNGAGP